VASLLGAQTERRGEDGRGAAFDTFTAISAGDNSVVDYQCCRVRYSCCLVQVTGSKGQGIQALAALLIYER
jgi:hypothetical protein